MTARAETARANREGILTAGRDLFRQRLYDQVSLEDVAVLAGVTVRTVVRRFGSKEQLYAEVAARRAHGVREQRNEVRPGDVGGAITHLVNHYEEMGDEVVHLLGQERRTETIGRAVRSGRTFHQAWVERVFSPLLVEMSSEERKRRLAQLTAATDVYVWKILRRDLGLGRDEVGRSLRDMVTRITA